MMKSIEQRFFQLVLRLSRQDFFSGEQWLCRNLKGDMSHGITGFNMHKASFFTYFLKEEADKFQSIVKEDADIELLKFALHHIAQCDNPWTDIAFHLFQAVNALSKIETKMK